MIKYILLAALSLGAAAAFAQASAPEASASATSKPKWVKKLKLRKPAQPAVNPQTSPDKRGGN
jgi:hypothetical protein